MCGLSRSRCYSGSFESVIQEWALVVSLTDDWEPNQSPLLICTRVEAGRVTPITPNATSLGGQVGQLPGRAACPAPAGPCPAITSCEELQGCSWQVLARADGHPGSLGWCDASVETNPPEISLSVFIKGMKTPGLMNIKFQHYSTNYLSPQGRGGGMRGLQRVQRWRLGKCDCCRWVIVPGTHSRVQCSLTLSFLASPQGL